MQPVARKVEIVLAIAIRAARDAAASLAPFDEHFSSHTIVYHHRGLFRQNMLSESQL